MSGGKSGRPRRFEAAELVAKVAKFPVCFLVPCLRMRPGCPEAVVVDTAGADESGVAHRFGAPVVVIEMSATTFVKPGHAAGFAS